MDRFAFVDDTRFRPLLVAFGVTRGRADVSVDDHLRVRFGFFSFTTPVSNIAGVKTTGPYRWYRSVGIRMSLTDRGLTFGTTDAGGVCVLFHEPVRGIGPFRLVRHPGITLTVDDPDSFVESVRRLSGI